MKVVTIVGARPQFIKSAPVSKAFQNADIKEFVIHTGQHYDRRMSAVFFEEMKLPKPYRVLDCGNMPHAEMVSKMLLELAPILRTLEPDFVLVYGDTNSTLAGALAATKLEIPLVHVEAGLRSYNLKMPEEMNRILTDRMSAVLFTPNDHAIATLHQEGFNHFNVHLENVGDVMFDALHTFLPNAAYASEMGPREFFDAPYALATLHRFENITDKQRLASLVDELNKVHREIMPVWMPLHPATQARLEQYSLTLEVQLAPPASYLQMLFALQHATLVLTDSGGLQKEAFFSKKPCITMRNETEWVELIELGVNRLFTSNHTDLSTSIKEALAYEGGFDFEGYGKGDAAQRIVTTLQKLG